MTSRKRVSRAIARRWAARGSEKFAPAKGAKASPQMTADKRRSDIPDHCLIRAYPRSPAALRLFAACAARPLQFAPR